MGLACDGGSSGGSSGSTGQGSTSSDDTTGTPGSTTDEPGTSTGGAASSSSTGVVSTTEDPSVSESDTTGSESECEMLGGTEIPEFELEFMTHRVLEEDVAVEPVAPLCLFADGDGWQLRIQWGEQMGADWESVMFIRVPSAGTYDLATDFGEPGSGMPTDASLSYSRTVGPETFGFDTANQGARGTLQVDAWPVEATDLINVRGDGAIGGEEGWMFVFSLETKKGR